MKLNQLKAALDGVLLTDTEFVNFKQSAIKNSKGDNVKKMVEVTVEQQKEMDLECGGSRTAHRSGCRSITCGRKDKQTEAAC